MTTLTDVRQKMDDQQLDVLLITNGHNRRYLSGFTGSAGILVITPLRQFLLADSRYFEQVANQAPDWELVKMAGQWSAAIPKLLTDFELIDKRIGFEADHLTVQQLRAWQKAMPDLTLVETTNLVAGLRQIKRPDELSAIRAAAKLADETMAHLYDWIQPGVTELDVAWELEVYFRTHGAKALSFDPIVAVNANAALPHAVPGDRVINAGDVVLIDMGCKIDGYASDITRTFSLGEPNHPDYLTVWQVVAKALDTANHGVHGQMPGQTADALARDVIKEAGYGDYFGHSLGHGVGLNVHEGPAVSPYGSAAMPTNAVVTIEPGIYLPGQFGVRLEDMVLLTETGAEILTHVPKKAVL